MHDYITQLVENKPAFYSFSVLLLLIFLRLGWWLGSSFTRKKTKKQFKELEKEKNVFQRENKKMWDKISVLFLDSPKFKIPIPDNFLLYSSNRFSFLLWSSSKF